MITRQAPRVTPLTTGTAARKFEHLRRNYVYGGTKTGDVVLAKSSTDRKQQRMEKLADLEAADPPLSLAEKARCIGLAPRTVRGYLRELEAAREAAS